MRARRGALAPLVAVVICLGGVVAYAAAPHDPDSEALRQRRGAASASLPRPTISRHPEKAATSSGARFVFGDRVAGLRFRCRLDRRAWKPCHSPASYSGLAAGGHSFSVRATSRDGRRSAVARFRWRVLEPMDFTIEPQLGGLDDLYPGAPAQALPVTVVNPNPVPIYVTSLSAQAVADPLGCASAENLIFGAAGVSSTAPLEVPATGSVSLPTPGAAAPTIELRDLPVNQDACQGARFPLAFSGRARG